MPLNIDFLQVLLHMLNFVILAGGLTLLLFKPVNKFLRERRERFEKLASENEEKARENERLKAEYEKELMDVEDQIADMRQRAEKETADAAKAYLNDAKEKASELMVAAEKEAEERKEHILDSAQTEIEELVLSATQKLLGDTVTPERNRALYDEFIRRADKTVTDERTGE